MTYPFHVLKRNPHSLWMVEGADRAFDATGMGRSATVGVGAGRATPLVAGAADSAVLDNTNVAHFPCSLFRHGQEDRAFALEAWVMPVSRTTTGPQQILSHDGQYDGLSIDGTVITFSTIYETYGTAACQFDIMVPRSVHVVGIHSADANQLWVNGVLVDSVELTDDQRGADYLATTDYLYAGGTTSDSSIAINGVAIYASISGEHISSNFSNGSKVLSPSGILTQYGGTTIPVGANAGSVFFEQSWSTQEDFFFGLNYNVGYDNDRIVPNQPDGISEAGSWTVGVPLDVSYASTIYGVVLSWVGRDILVETSVDGLSWTVAENGRLVTNIAPPFDPNDIDLSVRVSFAGGVSDDKAYLSSIFVTCLADEYLTSPTERIVLVTHPAAPREAMDSLGFSDYAGTILDGGTLTVRSDSSPEPVESVTLELWVKVVSGVFATNFTGTFYRNGAAWTEAPVGEWSLIHIDTTTSSGGSSPQLWDNVQLWDSEMTWDGLLQATDGTFVDDITVSGDVIVGQVTLYPTALSSLDIENIYRSYIGTRKVRIDDDSVIGVSSPGTEVQAYGYDWAITSAG